MGGGVKILYGENIYPVIKCGGGGEENDREIKHWHFAFLVSINHIQLTVGIIIK